MTRPPVPSFLALDETPTPGAWGPPGQEAHRGSSSVSPGPGNPESTSVHNVTTPPTPEIPGGKYKRTPAPPKVDPNYPTPEMGALDFLETNRILAKANEPQLLYPIADPGRIEDHYYWGHLDRAEQRFINLLSIHCNPTRAAEISGVSRGAMYARKKRSEGFAELWAMAMEHRGDLIEDEAMRRAIRGVEEPVFYMGAICGYKRVYSDQLLSKLLEGNKPEKFRNNHKVEVDGSMAVATLVLPATTTPEEWMAQHGGKVIEQLPEDEYGE